MILPSVITVVALPLLVVAHGVDYLRVPHAARQAPSPGSSSSSAPPASISGTVPSITSSASSNPTSTPNITVSLLSVNPTAVPLASIVSNEPSGATQPLSATPVAGTIPTFLPGAPGLPDVSGLNPANYPKMDVVPPTDSPQVLQWIQDVKNTGIDIPGFPPNNPGGCSNNTQVVAANNTCWWSCSSCSSPADVTRCPTPYSWGLTYDDGPAFYTTELLQYLDQHNLKSTFFTVGSRALQFPHTLQAEYLGEHQLAVHTWSHPYLTTLSNEQIIAELGWSKKIMKDVTGVTPNMMRPPYGDIDDRVRAISIAMGLTPTIWTRISPTATFDTGDFNIEAGTISVTQVLQNWNYILGNVSTIGSGFIVLEHDLFQQTVQIATGYILPDALAYNNPPFNITPIIECLHKPLSDAYIETNDNKSNPPPLQAPYVTTVAVPSSTASSSSGSGGSGSKSSADASFSVGFSFTFMTTALTLLAGVCAIRF